MRIKVERITRKLPEWAAAQVAALQAAHARRFPADDIADVHALFADAMLPAEPGSRLMVHRFPLKRAMELARGIITETAINGGDLRVASAAALFVLARRAEARAVSMYDDPNGNAWDKSTPVKEPLTVARPLRKIRPTRGEGQ